MVSLAPTTLESIIAFPTRQAYSRLFFCSTGSLLRIAEFDHLGVRFVRVQDQIDTASPMVRAMFTITGAMAAL